MIPVLGESFGAALDRYYCEIRPRLARAKALERTEGTHFNVFGYIQPDENRLSDITADLLDPLGTHGQGTTFLMSFLNLIKVQPNSMESHFAVKREDSTLYTRRGNRRIDITIEVGCLGIGIENKPWAEEGEDQLKDYSDHLKRKYPTGYRVVYLSGEGTEPSSLGLTLLNELKETNILTVMFYRPHVLHWINQCYRDSEAENVRCFLKDFATFIETQFEDHSGVTA